MKIEIKKWQIFFIGGKNRIILGKAKFKKNRVKIITQDGKIELFYGSFNIKEI